MGQSMIYKQMKSQNSVRWVFAKLVMHFGLGNGLYVVARPPDQLENSQVHNLTDTGKHRGKNLTIKSKLVSRGCLFSNARNMPLLS